MSIVVSNSCDYIESVNNSIVDKLKTDISYDLRFQKNNHNTNKNEVDSTNILSKYLTSNCPIKELYLYCSTATAENKLNFLNSVTPNSTFTSNCTKVYLPVQDVVDVASIANLNLPSTVEVIYSIPVGATCYTDLPIKYDL